MRDVAGTGQGGEKSLEDEKSIFTVTTLFWFFIVLLYLYQWVLQLWR